jgi:hypothetical protein
MTLHFDTNEVLPSIVENRSDISSSRLTYNSYSGTDMSAQILVPNESQPLVLGDLQTLSYSIHRENKPVRLLGQVSPAGFLKGPRTIAGSLIFVNFEAYTFYRLEQFKKLAYSSMTKNNSPLYGLADMLPPFDILITAQNEYGSFSRMRLLGVSVVDEGGTISIEDLVTESQYTFMARGIEPMTSYQPQFKVEDPLITTSTQGFGSGSAFVAI